MPEFAERSYGTPAFAPQWAESFGNTATTQHADVIARRERQSIIALHGEPRRMAGSLQIGEQATVLISSEFGALLPSWAPHVFQSLAERWGRKQGWDTYSAKPTDMQLVVRLLNYLAEVMQDNSTPPMITPLSDGGVQAEWHGANENLELVVSADDPATYYYYDASTGQEEEGELDPSFARMLDLIAHF